MLYNTFSHIKHMLTVEDINKIEDPIERKKLKIQMIQRSKAKELKNIQSEFSSYFLPAFMIGQNPKLKIIQATHTAELAVGFGRKTKHLIDSEDYQKIFKTRLQEDSKAAGRWNTSEAGEYFAVGVKGAVTGRGADL